MKSMPIATAIVICFMLACVTLLAWSGKDPTIALSLGLTVLGGIMYGEVRAVREQTNGNTTKMLSIVDKATNPAAVQSGQSTEEGDKTVG